MSTRSHPHRHLITTAVLLVSALGVGGAPAAQAAWPQAELADVTGVTLTPETITEAQTGVFEVSFGQPMDPAHTPTLSFASTQRNAWQDFNLPGWNIADLAVDTDNSVWLATTEGAAHFDGQGWHLYTTANSGLTSNTLASVEVDEAGVKWFVGYNKLISYDGATWTTIELEPFGLYNARPLSIAPDGTQWVGTNGYGLAHLQDGDWTFYSPIPANGEAVLYERLYLEDNATVWLLTNNHGVGSIQGSTVITYTPDNSPLSRNYTSDMAIDTEGVKWFASAGKLQRLEGSTFSEFDLSGLALVGVGVTSVTFDAQGDLWLAANKCLAQPCIKGIAHLANGQWSFYPHSCELLRFDGLNRAWCLAGDHASVMGNDRVYAVEDDGHWVNAHTYQASYDFSPLVPSGVYSLTVASAYELDGPELAAQESLTFTVDYAAPLAGQSAPARPSVFASGNAADTSALSAAWTSDDNTANVAGYRFTNVAGYRFAIGAVPGSADLVNWTSTAVAQVDLSGLGLVADRTYWISVQAQNELGLWSFVARDWFIAGRTKVALIYLPLIGH